MPANMSVGVAADYQSHLYVAPHDAQQWLQARLNAWKARRGQARNGVADQVLVLVGERGCGKTWFLQHLAAGERRVAPLAVYLDLDRRTEHATAQDYTRAINSQIRKQRGAAPTVLLLDHVPPQLDDYLRALEEDILRPQLANCDSLAVMALVHPSLACWRAPALRGGDAWTLRAFDGSQTREQIRHLEQAGLAHLGVRPAAVHRLSGGLPLLTYLLCTRERSAAFERLLQRVLGRVPDAERECVQSYLEAVCTLDVLEHAAIRNALAAYQACRLGAAGYPIHPIGLRNVLQKHWLAHPAFDAPGRIVLLAGLRRAVQELLKARDAELFGRLQEAARNPVRGQV